MQGGAVEESRWRAEAVQSVPEVAAHVPPHPGAIATAQDGVEPTPTRVSPPVLEAQPSALMEDNFGYNARQLEVSAHMGWQSLGQRVARRGEARLGGKQWNQWSSKPL